MQSVHLGDDDLGVSHGAAIDSGKMGGVDGVDVAFFVINFTALDFKFMFLLGFKMIHVLLARLYNCSTLRNMTTTSHPHTQGTSLIAVPKAEAAAINKIIGAFTGPNGQSFVNCTILDQLPAMTIAINQHDYVLEAKGGAEVVVLLLVVLLKMML